MEFIKYQHLERFGNDEVSGIELGECYVFPKLDGTNASVWTGPNSVVCGGSRNRQLSLDNDNAGFLRYVGDNPRLCDLVLGNPNLIFYGEWLVPHTLTTYRDDAWRRFWIFDVLNRESGQLLRYDDYAVLLNAHGVDYIPPLAKIKNGSYENFIHVLEQNNFFIQDGKGLGEGVVLKNYEFYNKFGRQVWAKIVRTEFKEEHSRAMGCPETETKLLEEQVAEQFVTEALVKKCYAKLALDGWNSKKIPELIGRVWYDLITEEMWNILKAFPKAKIDFTTLKHFAIKRIKNNLPEVFA